ncbi:MAG: helix-turn-helix domain-containing protein [Solirubrobacteraceae bacterium]
MADIGSTLREARMRARIDISEVEARTKIRAKYLRAIENEEWDLLPGPVYVKSFLKTYSEFLGLDSRLLIDEYKRRYERPSDGEMRPIATLSRERERAARGPLLPPWVIVAAVIVAIVVVLGLLGSNNNGPTKPTTPLIGVTGRTHHTHRHRRHRRARTGRVGVTAPAGTGTVKLQLTPTSAVYVCVTNGAGKKLINGVTYSPGQTIPTVTAPKLLVNLGNNGVQMKVNGIGVGVTASANAINFELTPAGRQSVPSARAATCP